MDRIVPYSKDAISMMYDPSSMLSPAIINLLTRNPALAPAMAGNDLTKVPNPSIAGAEKKYNPNERWEDIPEAIDSAGNPVNPNGSPLKKPKSVYDMEDEFESPLTRGATRGFNSARDSFEMTQQDKQRALGAALMKFASTSAASHNPSQLGAIAESFGPAADAFMQMEANAINKQYAAAKMAQDEQLKREQMANLAEYRNASLNKRNEMTPYQRKSLELQERRLNSKEGDTESNVTITSNGIPFNKMSTGERTQISKEMREAISNANNGKKVLHSLNEIEKISKEFPDLSTDFNRILSNADPNEKPTWLNTMAKGLSNSKKRAALEKFQKLNSYLVTSQIKTMGGGRITDIMKKNIMAGTAQAGMTPEAIGYVTDHMRKEIQPVVEYGEVARKGLLERKYYPPAIIPDEEPTANENVSPEESVDQYKLQFKGSQDFIKQFREKNPDSQLKDEQIINWGRTRGLV